MPTRVVCFHTTSVNGQCSVMLVPVEQLTDQAHAEWEQLKSRGDQLIVRLIREGLNIKQEELPRPLQEALAKWEFAAENHPGLLDGYFTEARFIEPGCASENVASICGRDIEIVDMVVHRLAFV